MWPLLVQCSEVTLGVWGVILPSSITLRSDIQHISFFSFDLRLKPPSIHLSPYHITGGHSPQALILISNKAGFWVESSQQTVKCCAGRMYIHAQLEAGWTPRKVAGCAWTRQILDTWLRTKCLEEIGRRFGVLSKQHLRSCPHARVKVARK